MSDDGTQAAERGIRARPITQPWLKRQDNVIQFMEVTVVQAAAANQFPHSFDGVEFWTVGRQEMQTEVVGHLMAPGFVETGMVIPRVVSDDYSLAPSATCYPFEFPQKLPAGLSIEHALRPRHRQFPVAQAHPADKADALSGGCVIAHWVLHLGGNPQATTRAMLLAMHFIHRPQIDFGLSCQCAEFFYARLATEGRLDSLVAGVC